MTHKVSHNPKTGRWTLMVQNPEKIGQFGEWKIKGSYPSKEEAEANA